VPKGIALKIETEKTGFTGRIEEVSFPANYVFFKEFEMDLYVDPLEVGREIVLDPIFFEQSKATVRKDSYGPLDELGNFLNEHENVRILVKGHTDNQGPPEALFKLSKERAMAIKNYLILKKRIHPLRVKTLGMGSTEPIAANDSEDGRIKNRRVEVEISEIEGEITVGKQ